MNYFLVMILVGITLFHIEDTFSFGLVSQSSLSASNSTIRKSVTLFDATNINCIPPYNTKFEVAASEENLKFINLLLEKPFYWLSKGTQSYVFLSENENYVLKIFKQRLRKPWRQVEQIYIGSKVAFEEMPEDSGIVFLHNIPNGQYLKNIVLYDDGRNLHHIDSDQISFLVQKRAQYIKPTIIRLMKNGNEEQAKVRLDQILHLLIETARKNIVDRDDRLISTNNIGFIEDRAIYIDTGRFIKAPISDLSYHIRQEFQKRLYSLQSWLRKKYPNLCEYFNEKTKVIVDSLGSQDINSIDKPFLNELQSYQNVVR